MNKATMKQWLLPLGIVLGLFSVSALAAPDGLTAVTVTTNDNGDQQYSLTLQVLILMTLLTMLPALLLMMTSFTRIIIVMGLLRQAIGTPSTPSNQILLGLAFFLTMFVMAPVFEKVHSDAIQPYLSEEIGAVTAIERAKAPIREFMFAQTRESDLMLFSNIAKAGPFASRDEVPFSILIAAFVTSELKTAFQIGFLVFLPFIVIDLVVASTLMSMGMMMLSPLIISLPFKILLFVLVDGWALIIGTLASSFYL